MSSNLKVNNILPSTGDTVAVSGIASVTSSVSIASSCTATTFYGSGANLTSLPAQATIANNADNRIITGGSGVNLNGESGLTFDGTTLTVAGASNATQAIFSGTGGSGSRGLEIKTESGGAVDEVVVIKTRASGTTGAIKFQTNGANSLELTGNGGDVIVKQGNLKFGIGGKGIDFSATSGSPTNGGEILDDYEEGNFTASLGGVSNWSSYSVTGQGHYVKIGKAVHINIHFGNVDLNNSASGSVIIFNLPFTPFIVNPDCRGVTSNYMAHKVQHANDGMIHSFYIHPTYGFRGQITKNNSSWTSWDASNFTATGVYLDFSATYFTSS